MTQTRVRKRKRKPTIGKAATLSARVAKLSDSFAPADIRAALVKHWAKSNNISANRLGRCVAVGKLLDAANPADVEQLCHSLSDTAYDANLKDLEQGFESLMDRDQRRDHGAVYTPEWIIDYLITAAIEALPRRSRLPVICDPACGSGGFLWRAAEVLAREYSTTYETALSECIVGLDRDPQSILQARCLTELFLLSRGANVSRVRMRLLKKDSLLEDPQLLTAAAGAEVGFDVVATNPPYVKLQNLSDDYRQQLSLRYGEFIKGSYSLALLFLLAGHRLLAAGGQLAYITQNNFFTSLAGEPLRRYLQQKRCVRRIIDFGHAHVFPNASAYTCLVFLGTDQREHIEFSRPDTPSHLCSTGLSNVPLERLDAKKWRLAAQPHLDNLHRIESTGVPLGQLADIRVGFATLRDAVFLVRDEGEECIAKGLDGDEVMIEREFTRAAVKVADLDKERDLDRNRTRIIFPYQESNGRFTAIPEQDIRRRFPNAYRHLMNCRELLQSRDKGKQNPDGWYAWGRAQGRDSRGPKLLTKTFDRRPNFMLDRSDQLFCNGYSVSLQRSKQREYPITIDLLKKILNSSVMHYYAKLTSFQIEGGFQCYQKNFIEKFGIPDCTRQQSEQLLASDDQSADELVASLYGIDWGDIREITGK